VADSRGNGEMAAAPIDLMHLKTRGSLAQKCMIFSIKFSKIFCANPLPTLPPLALPA